MQAYQETTTTRSLRSCRRTGRVLTPNMSLSPFSIAGVVVGLGSTNIVAAGAIMAAAARAIGATRWIEVVQEVKKGSENEATRE